MPNKFWNASTHIGGGAGAVDAIDGASLTAGDACICASSSGFDFYRLLTGSTEVESSPTYIVPDNNSSGGKVWSLLSVYSS